MKKNKSIRKTLYFTNAIIFIVITIVFLSISNVSIIKSTNNALKTTMIETAKLAASNISKQFELFNALFTEIAKDEEISDKTVSKGEIISYLETKNEEYESKYNCKIDVIYNTDNKSLIQNIDAKNYDFYKNAIEGKSLMNTPINIKEQNNELVFVYSQPIISDNDTCIGVLFVTFNYDSIYYAVSQNKLGKTGSVYLIDKIGNIIVHDDKSLVNVSNPYEESKTDKSKKSLGEMLKKAVNGETGYGEYKWNNKTKIAAYSTINQELGWSVFVATQKTEFTSQVNRTTLISIIVALVLLLISGGFFYIISNKIVNPIELIVKRMKMLAEGDLTTPVPDITTNDETKLLHISVVNTIDSLKKYISNINYVMSEIANNNLNINVDIDYTGDFTAIKNSLTKIINDLNNNMKDISQVADQVAIGADQISAGAQLLSHGATEQASSIEELSATINEVSESIKSNSIETLNANNLTEKALKELEKGNIEMNDMLKSMDEIEHSSNEISKIIKLIEDIAFQTNILSLNAAVEAARAGAAGKGFGVVADEVRNLASKSAEAAKNTTLLIEKALKAVASGTEVADSTAISLNEAVELSKNVSNIMKKITHNSNELTISISQILEGADQISSVVQTNSATAEESAASSEELSSQASILKEMLEKYNLK